MFILGHLGIGNKVASPWSRDLPKFPLFLGMLLPDIIDKTLFYSHIWPYVSCTRTFAHSGLFLLSLLLIAGISSKISPRVSRWFGALALGVSTHLLLDCLMDRFGLVQPGAAVIALTWPFWFSHFAQFPFKGLGDHLEHLLNAPILISEAVGAALLGWDLWKSRHRQVILEVLFSRRWRMLKRRRLERD